MGKTSFPRWLDKAKALISTIGSAVGVAAKIIAIWRQFRP